MRIATFAFTFDRNQAGYLKNAAYFRTAPPFIYIRQGNRGGHFNIIRDLLNSMAGSQTWSLMAGFHFVE